MISPHGFSLLSSLLDLDACAGLFELALDLVGVVLGGAFLDGRRSRVDELFRFLQAEPGDGPQTLITAIFCCPRSSA